jgi:hemerythrin
MAFFTWDDKYSVGVREMDSQHKTLIDLLNELFEAMNANRSKEILGATLSKLVNYTKTHFAAEERLMEQHNYPDLAAQKREHVALTDKVIAFKQDFDAGKVSMSVQLTSFLKSWLVDHIAGADKKYGPYLNSKGVS